MSRAGFRRILGSDLLSHRVVPCSTIGPGGFNDRVRDGIGCIPSGNATKKGWKRQLARSAVKRPSASADATDLGLSEIGKMAKPHGRLVPVSFTHYCASTPGLSPCGLQGALRSRSSGRPNLEGGFPLRCFQRLSFPDVATRRCGWRHNRNTRGRSIPVLSY